MCYQAAGPKGSDLIGDTALTVEQVKRMLDEVPLIPEIGRRFVTLDKEFALLMADEIRQVERKLSVLLTGASRRNLPKIDGSPEAPAFPLVLAVAAVVSAVSSVVSAVSLTYVATKWLPEPDARPGE